MVRRVYKRTAPKANRSQAKAVRRSFSGGGHDMKHVYLIQSIPCPDEHYVGIADDFQKRLLGHNSGNSKHTAKFRPWKPVVVIRFENDAKAVAFEKYLKSGSGRAFANRHLW